MLLKYSLNLNMTRYEFGGGKMNHVEPIRQVEDIKRMYEVMQGKNMRDYLFFKFAIHTGVKLNDLLNLTVSDVQEADGSIKAFWIEPHAPTIEIMLPQDLQEELSTYIKSHQLSPTGLLFYSSRTHAALSRQQAYRIVHEAAHQLSLEHIGLNTLRKTFAYQAYQSGVSLAIIQKYLGHQTTIETLKFIGISQQVDRTTIALNL